VDTQNLARHATNSSHVRPYANAIWANQVPSALGESLPEAPVHTSRTLEPSSSDDIASDAGQSEASDGLADQYDRSSTDNGPENVPIISLEDVDRLHRQMGHPSPAQLVRLLRNAENLGRLEMHAITRAIREHECSFCQRRARRRTPARPKVAMPLTSAPGQDIHLDVGHFRHPHTGPFQALVATDKFSMFVSGGVFAGPATAEKTIELFTTSTLDSYDRVTYDLGPNFRSTQFKSFLERQGSQAWAVPSDAHWSSASEKSIELLRVELDAVYEEFPTV
jgi:hypothetical protein